MREEEGEPRHAYDQGGFAAGTAGTTRTLRLHAPQDAHPGGIGSARAGQEADGTADAADGTAEGADAADASGTVGTAESGRSFSSRVHR